jgi:hypothetical protein
MFVEGQMKTTRNLTYSLRTEIYTRFEIFIKIVGLSTAIFCNPVGIQIQNICNTWHRRLLLQ